MDNKIRRKFLVKNNKGKILARGMLYSEMNVQVLWRIDIGHTAEQYANIGQLFGFMEGANTIEITE